MFLPHWGPPAWQNRWGNERGKPASQKPLTAEVSAKQSIKPQLHRIHVGAVGWEPHSSSTTACVGKVDHELPVNQSKGHTYTNPRPGHYLTHARSHITRAVAARDSCFALTSAHRYGIAVGQRPRKTLSCRGESFKCQLHTTGSWWLGTARQFSHDMRGEGGSWVWCMFAPCFNLSFENSELNCSTT